MLVRRLVSGVRSSWEASSTSWRWLSREVSRAAKQPVEGPPEPAELVGPARVEALRDTSVVSASSSTVSVRLLSGRSTVRPTARPSMTAMATPTDDDEPEGEGQVAQLLVDAGQRVW